MPDVSRRRRHCLARARACRPSRASPGQPGFLALKKSPRLGAPIDGSMKVVVVESPAKARTINKYLGNDYKVVASYGHVRDLPAKDGSVLPDSDFAMSWEVDGKSEKHVKTIVQAVRGADGLFLATDPDREGEAIFWHVNEVLNSRPAVTQLDVKRVVFNEGTKNAGLEAFRRPREIDRELVDAY